ncbi:hypothetical protein ScalyP_jg2508 [Parmales sp. scaly parma]|jgi:hypothetical protein|nr:hypothetical protein ScalyP_jg2508 [Parmales sp. scaly parma]
MTSTFTTGGDFDFSQQLTPPNNNKIKPSPQLTGENDDVTNRNFSNTASDWKPPCGPIRQKQTPKENKKKLGSAKTLKRDPNSFDRSSHWYGKKLNDSFWVPNRRGADPSTMRAIASKEFPMSTVEYRDADIFACGVLPSQYCPPKRDALEMLHPADLVDAEHPSSLSKKSAVDPWDGTVKNNVGSLIWRLRESVK